MQQFNPLATLVVAVSLIVNTQPLFCSEFTPPAVMVCDSPQTISMQLLTASFVDISWATPTGDSVLSYDWELHIGGFTPINGIPVFAGNTTETNITILGLSPLTDLSFFVRANCLGGGQSGWAGPLSFTVPPGCGNSFYDPGGPLGNYPNDTIITTVICPPSIGTDVARINFISFDLEENQDFLKIYDGTDNSAPLLANLTGYYPLAAPPAPVTATNTDGCLTTVFISSKLNNAEGWAALISCAAPDSCLSPGALMVEEISSDTAVVSWNAVAGAGYYKWELGAVPYTAGGTPLQSDTMHSNSFVLTGLDGQTGYVLYVRSVCDSVSQSGWVGFNFTTPIACGDTIFDTGGKTGNYNNDENYTTVICPNLPNSVVTLTFSNFFTENNKDILSIYNGNSIAAPEMGSFSGSIPNIGPFQATTGSGCLTLAFSSDAGTTKSGWEAVVSCNTPATCFQTVGLEITALTSHSVAFQWSEMFNAGAYQWEIGLGQFNPNAPPLQTDTIAGTDVAIGGLQPNTLYTLYVRSLCGGAASAWSVPLFFTTPPGCGDVFYDSGGAGSNYNDDEDITTVICPNNAGEVITLFFNDFKTQTGDVLKLYNGPVADPLYFIDSLVGNAGSSGPYVSTLANGCLTAHFTSDATQTLQGWSGNVLCAPYNGCPEIDGLQLISVTADGGIFSWGKMINAPEYEWVAVPVGLSPILPTATTADTFVTVTGLDQVATFDFYVRAVCGGGQTGPWTKITFTTLVNCFTSGNVLDCDNYRTAIILAGNGAWELNCTAPPFPTFGREQVYTFVPPVTQNYTLQVDPNINNEVVTYFYKPLSTGCDADDWECIEDFNSLGGIASFGPLVANQKYFILLDANFPSYSAVQKFRITNCLPGNDEAVGAVPIPINVPCSGNIHSNQGAGYVLGEPDPDTDPSDGTEGRWLDEANKTVWFKFEAPASGTITITSDGYPQGTNFDTQIALYSAVDPADYSTFTYIESDEDNGTILNGFNAVVYYTGLNPGGTYYVQVDGYGVAAGTFCLEILDGIERVVQEDCFNTFTIDNVDGTAPGGDHWYGIYTTPDILDLGQMVAAIHPGGNNLGSVSCKVNVDQTTIPLSPSDIPYMPAYFVFGSDNAPVLPVTLRLFFYNYELNALKAAAGLPNNTAADLLVTRYNGPTIDCATANNYAPPSGPGSVTLLTSVATTSTSGTASFYLDVTSDSLGEFGAHFGTVPLPVELSRFQGSVATDYNLLEWTTAAEYNTRHFLLERSANGSGWTPVALVPAAGNSSQVQHYAFADKNPLPAAYYRLRTVDTDGKTQLSHSIYLVRPEKSLSILRVYPSPTAGTSTLEFVTGREENVEILVTDLTGRLVLKQSFEAQTGLNQASLDLSNVLSGLYTVRVRGSYNRSEVWKIVRE